MFGHLQTCETRPPPPPILPLWKAGLGSSLGSVKPTKTDRHNSVDSQVRDPNEVVFTGDFGHKYTNAKKRRAASVLLHRYQPRHCLRK